MDAVAVFGPVNDLSNKSDAGELNESDTSSSSHSDDDHSTTFSGASRNRTTTKSSLHDNMKDKLPMKRKKSRLKKKKSSRRSRSWLAGIKLPRRPGGKSNTKEDERIARWKNYNVGLYGVVDNVSGCADKEIV